MEKYTKEEILWIDTEFIRLGTALKLANAVPSGGAAKAAVEAGLAEVNGNICTMRGKKLYPGDWMGFQNTKWKISAHEVR